MSRHRNYVFTHPNPPDNWHPEEVWENSNGDIQFLAGQYEISDSQLYHFQGYAVFANPQGLPGCRRLLQIPTGHFEIRQGSHSKALAYVFKDETRIPGRDVYFFGEEPSEGQGARSDVYAAKDILDKGGSLLDVAEENFGLFLRAERSLRVYHGLLSTHRESEPAAYYFWGLTGTGKSRAAWQFAAAERTYAVPLSAGNNVWFDGYVPGWHRVVIFDDYYHNFRYSFLLQLLDRYPIQVPTKGGFVKFNAPIVVFTSNIALDIQYPNIPDASALWRRFKRVVCLKDNVTVICSAINPTGLFLSCLVEKQQQPVGVDHAVSQRLVSVG